MKYVNKKRLVSYGFYKMCEFFCKFDQLRLKFKLRQICTYFCSITSCTKEQPVISDKTLLLQSSFDLLTCPNISNTIYWSHYCLFHEFPVHLKVFKTSYSQIAQVAYKRSKFSVTMNPLLLKIKIDSKFQKFKKYWKFETNKEKKL